MRYLALSPFLGFVVVLACGEPSVEEKCEIVYDRLFDACDQFGSYDGALDSCIRSWAQDDCHTQFDLLFECIDGSGECCEAQQVEWVLCYNTAE